MRVVHVTTSDMSLRFLLLDQLLYLRERGHDVRGLSGPGPARGAIEAAGIPVDTVPLTRKISPLRDLVALAALFVHFVRTRPDLVHTHTPKASLLGQWAALFARVRGRVHTSHGLYFPGHMRPGRRWFYVWLERLQMAPAHVVLAINPEDLDVMRRDRICDMRKVRYLGSGIDLERFHPRNREPGRVARIRGELGIPRDHVVVGMVARVVREKGYLEFLEAARQVRAAFPRTTFLCAGPYEPWKADAISEQEIAAFGLGDGLRMLGQRDDVQDLYASMDVLALPSHREGFPYAPMEASATGIPVVATDIRGCRQTVVDGESGILVPPRDARALARALERLVADATLRQRMGERARALAEERFDQREVFARVAAAYASL